MEVGSALTIDSASFILQVQYLGLPGHIKILCHHLRALKSAKNNMDNVLQNLNKKATIEISSAYGLVVLISVIYCILNTWMAVMVGKARKRYKVFYPIMYAMESENKDAKLFNCVQRGHQNSLEMMPVFFLLLLLGGIQHPLVAAIFGLIYCVGRYFYFTGYATGIPQKRTRGMFYVISVLGLLGCTLSFAWHLIFNGINPV